jgi:hypothetical protein
MARLDVARNKSGSRSIVASEVTLGDMQNSEKFRLGAGGAARRVSWLISPKARGTSHLNWDREGEHTLGRPKHFRTSDRPRNSRERNWSTRQMSAPARSILICRKGRSPQRRCLNGSKNPMKPIWLEPASSAIRFAINHRFCRFRWPRAWRGPALTSDFRESGEPGRT